MGWIREVGIERVLRGDICKSDFFLNLFWIFSDIFLVEFYSWEFSWTSGWIPEVGIERVLRSDIWGSGHLPLASTSSHLEPASVYFFQTFPQKTFWSSSSSSWAPFLFIVCISPPCQTFANLPKLCFLLLSTISPNYSAQIKEKYSATSPKAQFSIRSQNNQLSNKEKYCRHKIGYVS